MLWFYDITTKLKLNEVLSI